MSPNCDITTDVASFFCSKIFFFNIKKFAVEFLFQIYVFFWNFFFQIFFKSFFSFAKCDVVGRKLSNLLHNTNYNQRVKPANHLEPPSFG